MNIPVCNPSPSPNIQHEVHPQKIYNYCFRLVYSCIGSSSMPSSLLQSIQKFELLCLIKFHEVFSNVLVLQCRIKEKYNYTHKCNELTKKNYELKVEF